ncbi:LuxR family transcriptional regulator [Clostridium carboxidivorans P7]|uniref:Stage 0 sporulation protein A homolog n=1 Tax=Clostridium carboxidivorans P7 TaxID=536227 RepID=C6PUF3_9CLOT|nr:response regulator transcription factor [Clostridium carboxidivorans]AKN30547.1 LuxR family transcriptional regulator [Clostridium carboxidivorans P7]EET87151.1 two component transcriptional regulator, LuxR family [Clostridium carboxidivorans P7]EFG86293.1 response regulator receiver domain protein [Clostridium carboxidivorans P7]
MSNIKILIADDQTLMRDGLKTILELEENFTVVGAVKNGSEVLEFCKQNVPDLILMDIRMPEMDGVKCTKMLKALYPQIIILILTTFNDGDYIIEALNYGASGYILKDIEGDELIKAINDAYKGSMMLPSTVAKKLVQSLSSNPKFKPNEKKVINELSERETEIAKMLSMGFNNKQIASSLFISEGTVKNYISNIYSKLGTSDRTSAAIMIKKML